MIANPSREAGLSREFLLVTWRGLRVNKHRLVFAAVPLLLSAASF